MPLEKKDEPVASFALFLKRWFWFGLMALLIIGLSIGIGMLGYRYLAHLDWVDSLYMASMILTGMGPTEAMNNDAAKIFSSVYALYSGVAFLSICAVFFAPVIHRFLHKLHVDDDAN